WAIAALAGKRLVADNCLFTAGVSFYRKAEDPKDASLRLTRNTFRTGEAGAFRFAAQDNEAETFAAADWTVKAVKGEASGNLFHVGSGFQFYQAAKVAVPPGEAEAWLGRMAGWQGERNAYAVDRAFLYLGRAGPGTLDLPPPKLPAGLVGWKQLWGE